MTEWKFFPDKNTELLSITQNLTNNKLVNLGKESAEGSVYVFKNVPNYLLKIYHSTYKSLQDAEKKHNIEFTYCTNPQYWKYVNRIYGYRLNDNGNLQVILENLNLKQQKVSGVKFSGTVKECSKIISNVLKKALQLQLNKFLNRFYKNVPIYHGDLHLDNIYMNVVKGKEIQFRMIDLTNAKEMPENVQKKIEKAKNTNVIQIVKSAQEKNVNSIEIEVLNEVLNDLKKNLNIFKYQASVQKYLR